MHGPYLLNADEEATPWFGADHGICDVAIHITEPDEFTGTVTFEACVQGYEDDAQPIALSDASTPGTLVTTATGAGLFQTQNGWAGGLKVRARISAYTSGSVEIRAATAE